MASDELFICSCGRVYRSRVACLCGQNSTVCIHRGDATGDSSCGCGRMYWCNLLAKWCAPRVPGFELYTITLNASDGTSVQLSEATFQACLACPSFAGLPVENQRRA